MSFAKGIVQNQIPIELKDLNELVNLIINIQQSFRRCKKPCSDKLQGYVLESRKFIDPFIYGRTYREFRVKEKFRNMYLGCLMERDGLREMVRVLDKTLIEMKDLSSEIVIEQRKELKQKIYFLQSTLDQYKR